MQHKSLILSLFFLVALAQLYIPASMIFDREEIIEEGKSYRFKTHPIDPADPLRGRYVILGYENDYIEIPGDSIFFSGQDVYVILKEDDQGFANIADIELEKPAGNIDFVKARINSASYYRDTSHVSIGFPFDRYYMEEYKAPLAEDAHTEAVLDSGATSYALVKVKDGEAVLTDVLIDDVSINELVKNQQ